MIVLTIVTIAVYGFIALGETGNHFSSVDFINKDTFTSSIGFSVYAFEGIGLIIPVQDVTALNEKQYRRIVFLCFFTCASLFIGFGTFCSFVWGSEIGVLITENLPENDIISVMKILFCLMLVLSYPL